MDSELILGLARAVQNARQRMWSELRISDLWLDNLFTSVRLSDGSVGVALNYDQEGFRELSTELSTLTRTRLLESTNDQPLLWDVLVRPVASSTMRSLLIALLSALSAPLLRDPAWLSSQGLFGEVRRVDLARFRHHGARVMVIGGGGYVEEALTQDWIQQLVCCDLNFAKPELAGRYEGLRQRLQQAKSRMDVVLDCGEGTEEHMKQVDIVCITASTLCNGTLPALLSHSRAKVVILEGPSGGLHPIPLLERGVTHLVHNPVDVDYVRLSQRFSRQRKLGLQRVTSGEFIDLILPEQYTVRGAAGLALEKA